jgi:hypothetical protein
MRIERLHYTKLPDWAKKEARYESDCGCGFEHATYLLLFNNEGSFLEMYSDAMEPEDACFSRDLSWIEDAILEAYQRGKDDADLRSKYGVDD